MNGNSLVRERPRSTREFPFIAGVQAKWCASAMISSVVLAGVK